MHGRKTRNCFLVPVALTEACGGGRFRADTIPCRRVNGRGAGVGPAGGTAGRARPGACVAGRARGVRGVSKGRAAGGRGLERFGAAPVSRGRPVTALRALGACRSLGGILDGGGPLSQEAAPFGPILSPPGHSTPGVVRPPLPPRAAARRLTPGNVGPPRAGTGSRLRPDRGALSQPVSRAETQDMGRRVGPSSPEIWP